MIQSTDTVLITGGTGFTGTHLAKKIVETGASVRIIVRASSQKGDLTQLPIEWIEGDVFNLDVVKRAVEGVNYIFHLAAAYREAGISNDVYWNVHVLSTKLLAQAALEQVSFKRFVHVSTVGVHGHIEHPPADESYRFSPGDTYQNTKVEGEQWIREFSKTTGLSITVIRPAAIYGPGDLRLLKVFKLAKLPVMPLFGIGGLGLYHLIHVDDLVRFIVVAAYNENANGEVFICGSEQSSSIKEIVTIIAKFLNKKARFITLPAWPFFLLGDLCEFVCKPLGLEPPIYRRRVAFFTKDRAFDTSKMKRLTGFQCEKDDASGLRALANWYVEKGWL